MTAVQQAAANGATPYRRRRPERTLLYRTVQTHFQTWLALARDGAVDGDPVPAHVEREFRRYLDCGILAHGFARARCGECGHDFLIAFSCKGRGVCPSRGISSSGYLDTGLTGNIGNFNNGTAGTNLDGSASLDGINFGIVSAAAGFNPNGGLANDPLIRDTVVFVLSGVSGLSILDISDVSFQYGTNINELNVPGGPGSGGPGGNIPEPATALLLGLGLLGLALRQRRKG